ncbi:actinin-like protein, partial [Reticulomyxa filosa]
MVSMRRAKKKKNFFFFCVCACTSSYHKNSTFFFNSPEERLLHWCNEHLPEKVKIANFTTDFQSGLTLVYLLNAALREEERLSQDDIEDMEPDDLLKHVLGYAEERLKIPQLLDVWHILENPDKQAMMTYVSLVRTAVDNRDQERSKLNQSMAKMKEVFHSLEDQLRNQISFLEKELNATKLEIEMEKGNAQTESEKYKQDRKNWAKEKDDLRNEIESLKQQLHDTKHEHEM